MKKLTDIQLSMALSADAGYEAFRKQTGDRTDEMLLCLQDLAVLVPNHRYRYGNELIRNLRSEGIL